MQIISKITSKAIWLLSFILFITMSTTNANATFSTVNCSNTTHIQSLGIPQVECEALEVLWGSTNGATWTTSTNWDTLTPVSSWFGILNVVPFNVSSGNIITIDLRNNNLTGVIPDLIGLSQTDSINLQGNELSGIIPNLSNLTNLQIILLDDNNLTGSIPNFNTQNLHSLWVHNNQLTGSMPDLSSHTNLEQLVVQNNQLEGNIPDYSGLPVLRVLRFYDNKFVFSDFESEHAAYGNMGLSQYIYSPQAVVDLNRSETVVEGSNLTITPQLANNANDTYQWFLNSNPIPGPAGTQRIYSKIAASADAGNYTYDVNNTIISDLTLKSHNTGDAITVTVTPFVPVSEPPVSMVFDIDGNGSIDALTDGLMLIKYLFGFRDINLISGSLGSGATRTIASDVETYINVNLSYFDIDDNGQTDALTDGLMALRYLFGFRGIPLISNAVATDANRTTAADIESYIQSAGALQPQSQISGRITLADGSSVTNSTVDVLDTAGVMIETIVAAADGTFTLTGSTGQELILKVWADGFANQITPVKLPALESSSIPMNIGMIPRGAAQTINIDAGGTLQGNGGSLVTLSAGSFVDSAGNTVTGNITATITPVDVSNKALLSAFPGDFKGIVESTLVESAIASLGTVEYVFKDSNGENIQLGPNATADIEIPVYITTNPQTGNAIEVGDSIDLWSLNETTGIWEQEGSGVVVVNTSSPTGLALRATVSHFSWWNCDVTVEPGKVSVTVQAGQGVAGTAVFNARTDANIGFRPSQVNRNVQIGQTSNPMFIASGGETCIWVDYIIGGSTASTPEQCINPVAQNGMYNLTFNIISTNPLEIGSSTGSNVYNANVPFDPITIFPYSIETSVDYVITSGSLPPGLSLTSISPTVDRIQGVPTVAGSYPFTIQATDTDNNMVTLSLTIVIVDPPAPTLNSSLTVYGQAAENITRNLVNSSLFQNSSVPSPTSWSITMSDGSAVPANVSISSAGVLSILNYDSNPATYHVVAYNVSGGSNTLVVDVQLLIPPVLQTTTINRTHQFDIAGITQELSISVNSLNSGGPVFSSSFSSSGGWSISPNNGFVTMFANGVVHYQGGSPGLYLVTASNPAGQGSGVITLNLLDDPIDCGIDPLHPICPIIDPCFDPSNPNPDPNMCP